MEREYFEAIFYDAVVIDVDFSEWDRLIRLCVIARDVDYGSRDRLPAYIASFIRPRRFDCKFSEGAIELEDPSDHCVWNVLDFDVKEMLGQVKITLTGLGPAPTLMIECEDVELCEIDSSTLDRLFPNWNRPSAPLVRPGIQSLAKTWL